MQRHISRAALAEICSVTPDRMLQWEFGWSKIPDMKLQTMSLWLRVRSGDLKPLYVKRVCAICKIPDSLERAHIIPNVHGGSERPENLIMLCATDHLRFDRGRLDASEAELIWRTALARFESCGGEFLGECTSCEYMSLFPNTYPPCCDERLLGQLSLENGVRLKPNAA
jgi:hypothetical protein